MADDLSGFSMLELFRLEAESQTAVLSEGVLAIEELDKSPKTVESMMRAAHSLKGAARIVGLEPAVQVAHALEDVFVLAGKGSLRVLPAHADVLLAAIDFLGSIGSADEATAPESPWTDRSRELVTRLEAIAAGRPEPQPTTPPPSPSEPLAQPASAGPGQSPIAPSQPPSLATEAHPPTPEPGGPPAIPPGRDQTTEPARPRGVAAESADRVVRVSAESLTRLVGLAGEALVETRQMRPFVDALLQLRSAEVDLCDALAALDEKLKSGDPTPTTKLAAIVTGVRERADAGLATLSRHVDDFESFARRNEDLSNRLHHEVIVSRMRPLADGIRGFPRLVRDLARSLGKQVHFEVVGDQTGVASPANQVGPTKQRTLA